MNRSLLEAMQIQFQDSCPNLSPILYLFYNADLIEAWHDEESISGGFINDTAILTWGDSTLETYKNLGFTWATTNASILAPEKFQLTQFTRARPKFDINAALQMGDRVHPA
ncbi:hypothetical protein S40288_09479 [Stachybotrys chartarum IBT 40288]|nr:hypothetical protein S40288_09479 [Stachybotrys chartarum IBT 40288]